MSYAMRTFIARVLKKETPEYAKNRFEHMMRR
jgi:hypothetical protein